MASTKAKSKVKRQKTIETGLGGFADDFKDAGRSMIVDGAGDWLDMLGIPVPTEHQQKEPKSGQEIEVYNAKVTSEQISKTETRIEAAIDYHREIVKAGEHATKQETHAFKSQIEQIKAELLSLAKSTKMLQLEVASVTVEQAPENAGTYHQHFFEWMLNMLKAARERVETSEAWMSAQKNKAGKKGYWGMFKKHGTSFGLSNERAVATQVG